MATCVALAGQNEVLAHSVTVDGNLADWCFNSLPAGPPDSLAYLTPPVCAAGPEIVWYDRQSDRLTLNDLAIVGVTTDANFIYFAGKLFNAVSLTSPPHAQIAIDVIPGGATTWLDPFNLLGTNRKVGQSSSPIIRPDYMITTDLYNGYLGLPGAALFQAITSPGNWTYKPPSHTAKLIIATSSLEIAIPWTAFACTGCPAFGPNSAFRFTFMLAKEDLAASNRFTPKGPIDDVASEEVAGFYTTTTTSCVPSTIKTTACELADTSADAFMTAGVPSGEVPDGSTAAPPLTIDKGPGGNISLAWAPSCYASDTDYEIYEGLLSSFTSHVPVASCTTGGLTTKSILPNPGSTYYLVVPTNGSVEGSYGTNGMGVQRPRSTAACKLRVPGSCPP